MAAAAANAFFTLNFQHTGKLSAVCTRCEISSMRRVVWVQTTTATTAKRARNLDSDHAKCRGVQQTRSKTPFQTFWGYVRRARIKIHFHPSHLTGPKIGGKPHAQTVQDIVTKLGTATHWPRPGVIAEPEFQNSSARGHFVGENFSHFALWRKILPIEFHKKITPNRRHPYAHFCVEISTKS